MRRLEPYLVGYFYLIPFKIDAECLQISEYSESTVLRLMNVSFSNLYGPKIHAFIFTA